MKLENSQYHIQPDYAAERYFHVSASSQYGKKLEHTTAPSQYSPFPSALDETPASVVDRMLFEKKDVLKERIELTHYQMQARKELYKNNMDRIDEQDCGIGSKMTMLDTSFPGRALDHVVLKRKQGLEQELHQLHKERRGERTTLWDDLQKLYLGLMDTVQEYRNACLREDLVGGDEND